MHSQQLISFGVIAVVFVALMAWRMRRMMTATPFNPYRAWVLPMIFIVFLVLAFLRAWPLGATEWVWVAAAGAAGAGLGWLRGKSITMTYDPVTRQIFAQGGAMAMIFIVVLIVVRTGLNYYLHTQGGSLGIRSEAADVIFSTLGAGLFIARSIELGVRGHRMLVANSGAAAVIDAP